MRSSNLRKCPVKNPAPLLQAAILGKPKRIARNVMEGGYTEGTVKSQTYLTAPQGIIKNY